MNLMNHTRDILRLWGAGTSRTFRPIWLCEELQLDYELTPIGPRTGETKTEQYTRLNRKQKVPYMYDGAIGLSESVAMCRYLISKYGHRSNFYQPQNLADHAKEDEWVCYIYGELDETSLYVMRRHRDLKEIYGEAPAAVEAAKNYLDKHLNVVERHIRSSTYVMGETFGLADILLVSCLDWAVFYSVDLPGELTAYRDRIAARPAYQKAFNINFQQLIGANDGTTK